MNRSDASGSETEADAVRFAPENGQSTGGASPTMKSMGNIYESQVALLE